MKRSQMLEHITDLIAFNRNVTADKVAEAILNLVEEKGMKPPVFKRCPVLLTHDHFWEKEDEQNSGT
jgi:hypothetical protein